MASITWSFDGTPGNFRQRGLSFPWSVNVMQKTTFSVEFLDFLFNNKLDQIESGNKIAIKRKGTDILGNSSKIWVGNLVSEGITTHSGYLMHSEQTFSVTIDEDYLNSKSAEYGNGTINQLGTPNPSANMNMINDMTDVTWRDYEYQDFSDISLGFGEQFVGYPYLTNGLAMDGGGIAEADGRFMRNMIQYLPDSGTQTSATWVNHTNQWSGSGGQLCYPGSSYRINFEPTAQANPQDISNIENIFTHPSGGSYFGPRSFYSNNKPMQPWAHYENHGPNVRTAVRVYIQKPAEGGYGIKNINGEQLLTPKHASAPLKRRPAIWWGSTGNCDVRLDNTANADDRILTMSVESQAPNNIDAIGDGGTFDSSDFITLSFGSNHKFPANDDAKTGGQVAYFTGFTGAAAFKCNGFRRVERVDADTIKLWTNGGIFDDEGNALLNQAVGSTTAINMLYCGDAYGNLIFGSSGGTTEHGPSYTYEFDNLGGGNNPAALTKYAFRGCIHDGTPGGGILGANCKKWNGYSGGILSVTAGITDAGWTNSDAQAGEGFGDGDEEITITMDRFKCTQSTLLGNNASDDLSYIGGWIPQRISWPGRCFGVGNGDALKIRVWDPLTQAFWAGKFVTSNGTPIAALAGNIYYGKDPENDNVDPTTYTSTGWSTYFDRTLVHFDRGQILTPLNNNGVGIQLEAITNSN